MGKLNEQQAAFAECTGHALVLGGPGSGKTTSALIKAGVEIADGCLENEQRVLFLSFARATVTRLCEHAKSLLKRDTLSHIEVNTYHGFWWRLLKSHLYLLNGRRSVRLLTPPDAASLFAGMSDKDVDQAKRRLYAEEGRIDFDQFAPLAGDLLEASRSLRQVLADSYPIIVLDEFQDTDSHEWRVIRLLGETSRLIALADPEQRIYEFRGADPARIKEYIEEFRPTIVDFGTANYRSNGTDIAKFGNDLLTGAHKNARYSSVAVVGYQFRKGQGAHSVLKSHVLAARNRMLQSSPNGNWSVAVLVPTKRLMIDVSDYLGNRQEFAGKKVLPPIEHDVAVDAEGPTLAAVLIAGLLDHGDTPERAIKFLLKNLVAHMRGRRGSQGPTQEAQRVCDAINAYCQTGTIRGPKRKQLIAEAENIIAHVTTLTFSGDPGDDWLSVRKCLGECQCDPLALVAEDAKYLRLLHKGGQLRNRLGELWRNSGTYEGASAAVEAALIQEHFSASTRSWDGVAVMTLHKSKGKEFDEVILYEGVFQGRYVRDDATEKQASQALLALRVGVTRARQRTTILTPKRTPSRLLA